MHGIFYTKRFIFYILKGHLTLLSRVKTRRPHLLKTAYMLPQLLAHKSLPKLVIKRRGKRTIDVLNPFPSLSFVGCVGRPPMPSRSMHFCDLSDTQTAGMEKKILSWTTWPEMHRPGGIYNDASD